MVAEAPLNAEAPEFHPNSTQLHNKKLQSISWPTTPFPFSMISFQHHRYFFVSSYRQPPFFYYKYPTFTPTLPHHQQFLEPEPEVPTTHPHTMAHEPTGLEAQQKKEAVEAVEKASGGGSSTKGVVAVPKAITLMEGTTRRSGGTSNLKAYAWRRKDSKEKNQVRPAVMSEQYFRAFPQKKQVRPVVPMRRDGDETTVMIRNIPSKYTREMLVQFLENHCMVENSRDVEERSDEENVLAFDFVYLPIDFGSGLNKGYAFVNFTKPKAAWKFLLTASNRKWDLFLSHKIREVVAARLQGKEKLEKHFETMNFPCESEDVLPVCFSPPRDGVTKGNQRTMGNLLINRA